jgi:hypothetical protein
MIHSPSSDSPAINGDAMLYVCLYLIGGIGVYFLMRLLFRHANADGSTLTTRWFGDPLAIIIWPFSLLISLIWWFFEVQHLKEKRKRAEAKAKELWHDGFSTDELIARQKKKLEEFESAQSKDDLPR